MPRRSRAASPPGARRAIQSRQRCKTTPPFPLNPLVPGSGGLSSRDGDVGTQRPDVFVRPSVSRRLRSAVVNSGGATVRIHFVYVPSVQRLTASGAVSFPRSPSPPSRCSKSTTTTQAHPLRSARVKAVLSRPRGIVALGPEHHGCALGGGPRLAIGNPEMGAHSCLCCDVKLGVEDENRSESEDPAERIYLLVVSPAGFEPAFSA